MGGTDHMMTITDQWAWLVGFIAPIIVSVISKQTWTSQRKRLVSVGVAIVLGVVTLIVQGAFSTLGEWTWQTPVTVIVLVVGASQAAYALLWKPTGVADKVEAATTSALSEPRRNDR